MGQRPDPQLGGTDGSPIQRMQDGRRRDVSHSVVLGHVAIYCRFSTDDQSCKRQERDLRAFAKRAGHHIIGVFKETASGAKNDRVEREGEPSAVAAV
jgi:hypothetical protein